MSDSNIRPELNAVTRELLMNNGWKESSDPAGLFCRSHQIGDYLWTEELDMASRHRLTYIQEIKAKRSDLDKALGETAQRYAHIVGDLFAANVPFRRTGIGKLRAYRQGEALAKVAGSIFSKDLIDSKKLFMLVHGLRGGVEAVITADSAEEASIHIATMRELVGMPDIDSAPR